MKRFCYFLLVFILFGVTRFHAFADAYRDYIDAYGDLAVAQQEIHGIPASITLAQGLLESAAGRSALAREGNNHFGIKCHSGWEGPTMLRNDDAPDECFRVYESPEESFRDHSRFLLRKRYAPLFELDPLDYAGWAQGLRQCGYATDPNYAVRLITIIERYALYLFDTPGGRSAEENTLFIQATLAASHPIRKSRGLHYVIAAPGDTYASLAKELKMDKKKLMRYNDARKDTKIKDWEEVYLQEKHEQGPENVKTAVIGDGESFHSIAQRYAMKLSVLRALNPTASDTPGTRLRLR